MNRLIIGLTFIAFGAMGCELFCPKHPDECPKKECEPGQVTSIPVVSASSAKRVRPAQFFMKGSTYPASLIGKDALNVYLTDGAVETTMRFSLKGRPIDFGSNPDGNNTFASCSKVDEVRRMFGGRRPAAPFEFDVARFPVKLEGVTQVSPGEWLVIDCTGTDKICPDFEPPLDPDIVPPDPELCLVKPKVEPVRKIQTCEGAPSCKQGDSELKCTPETNCCVGPDGKTCRLVL